MNLKVEKWHNHEIRFVEVSNEEWWAVAKDVAIALGYKIAPHMVRMLDPEEKDAIRLVDTIGRKQRMTIISETGIYEAAFNSEKVEAKEFKRWVKDMIRQFRKKSGLEGFHIFRMLDKDHQKQVMLQLRDSLSEPVQLDFIKANTITNKAVSTMYGHPKMLKKEQMTPEMLLRRQPILEDTVSLMAVKEKFGLDLSVSEIVYGKYH